MDLDWYSEYKGKLVHGSTSERESYIKFYDALKTIDDAPSVPTVEPKRGEWLEIGDDWIKCSLCGKEICYDANFCPNCGADMRGGGK